MAMSVCIYIVAYIPQSDICSCTLKFKKYIYQYMGKIYSYGKAIQIQRLLWFLSHYSTFYQNIACFLLVYLFHLLVQPLTE
jgi:hypothetical protein